VYAACTASRALRVSCALAELVEFDTGDGPADDRVGVDGGNWLADDELGSGGADGRDWFEE
jgi:hypothetical protein